MTATSLRAPLPAGLAEGISRLNTLTMDGDFDGARLWLAHWRERVHGADLDVLRHAMGGLLKVLGPPGGDPGPNLGPALIDVTKAFESLLGPG